MAAADAPPAAAAAQPPANRRSRGGAGARQGAGRHGAERAARSARRDSAAAGRSRRRRRRRCPRRPPPPPSLPGVAAAPPPPRAVAPPPPPRLLPAPAPQVGAGPPRRLPRRPPRRRRDTGLAAATASPANTVSVTFVNGSAALPSTATDTLKQLAARRGSGIIAVTGYGDAASDDPDAQSAALALGLSRAQAMAAALTRRRRSGFRRAGRRRGDRSRRDGASGTIALHPARPPMSSDPSGEFHRIRRLPPYVFAEVNTAKAKARGAGEDIIDLGMGNPDSPTPPHIVAKLVEAVQDPRTHRYSVSKGIPGLRRALAGYYQRRFDVGLDPETEVIATLGSKEGLANLASAITSPGDTILVPNPSYPIHQFGFIIAGAAVRSVPATPDEEMLRALDRAVRHSVPKPTALIVNFPSNPTAYLADLDFYREIVAFARRHEIWIMSDLAYAEIYFGDKAPPSLLQVPGAKEIAVEFTSLSKTYSMPGWRMGFAAGNARLINALTRMKSYLDYGAFTPIQVAAAAALNGPQDCVDQIRALYRERRDVLIRGLASAGWDVPSPDGSMFAWAPIPPRFSGSGQRRVLQAAAGARQGGGRAGARLRRARRGVRAHRAGGEHPPAAPGGAEHPGVYAGGDESGGAERCRDFLRPSGFNRLQTREVPPRAAAPAPHIPRSAVPRW